MYKFMRGLLRKIFFDGINKLPVEYRDEFYNEFYKLNLRYALVFAIIFIIFNISISLENIIALGKNIDVGRLIMAHGLVTGIAAIYAFLFYKSNKGKFAKRTASKKILYLSFIIMFMGGCTYSSVRSVDGVSLSHISAYLLGIFCIATFLEMEPLEAFIIYFASFISLSAGLIHIVSDTQTSILRISNSGMITTFAYIASRYKFRGTLYNFISRKDQIRALKDKEKYESLRTEFFTNISHELRTPLNVIFSSNQMLELSLKNMNIIDNSSKTAKYMYLIKQNCYRLTRLINNLIDITKIDSGYLEICPVNCNIVKVVEDITLSVSEYAEQKNINLVFDTDIEEKNISCDPEKIERIMLNLISNSLKFTPEGGDICVSIFDKQDWVRISVKDSGIGIPSEKQSKIFDRFVQVDRSLSRTNEGSGIGLALVKSLVDMHEGYIKLNSGTGKGSEFVIELPAKIKEAAVEAQEVEHSDSTKRIEKINIEFSDIYF